jgi:thioredoxin 1
MAIDVVVNNAEDFNEELTKYPNKQVIVDFWAEWCGPCRAVSPLLNEIESEDENVVLLKVNVDDNRALADTFHIQSIPTLMFFKNATQNAESIMGVTPKQVIVGRYSQQM